VQNLPGFWLPLFLLSEGILGRFLYGINHHPEVNVICVRKSTYGRVVHGDLPRVLPADEHLTCRLVDDDGIGSGPHARLVEACDLELGGQLPELVVDVGEVVGSAEHGVDQRRALSAADLVQEGEVGGDAVPLVFGTVCPLVRGAEEDLGRQPQGGGWGDDVS